MNVVGLCPMGCGSTLFLGDGGYVTCGYLPCPDPGRAADMLNRLPSLKRMVDAAVDAAITRAVAKS